MRSLQALLVDWRGARTDMERLMKNMPRIIGNESVKIVKQNFKIQGYDNGLGVDEWAPRDDKTNAAYTRNRGKGQQGIYKGSVFSASKPLLRQTLNLYNNIRYRTIGMSRVFIGGDTGLVPYMRRHNEGLDKMPKRQFMPTPNQGANVKMQEAYRLKYEKERDRAMRRFQK